MPTLAGSTYASSMFYSGALFGTAFLAGVDNLESWRAAAFISTLAYPLGIHMGYQYGERRRNEPGRIYLAQALANQGVFTGAITPFMLHSWNTDADARDVAQLAAVTGIAGGIGGHLLGDRMFPEQHIARRRRHGRIHSRIPRPSFKRRTGPAHEDGRPFPLLRLVARRQHRGNRRRIETLPKRRDTRERSFYISGGSSLEH